MKKFSWKFFFASDLPGEEEKSKRVDGAKKWKKEKTNMAVEMRVRKVVKGKCVREWWRRKEKGNFVLWVVFIADLQKFLRLVRVCAWEFGRWIMCFSEEKEISRLRKRTT